MDKENPEAKGAEGSVQDKPSSPSPSTLSNTEIEAITNFTNPALDKELEIQAKNLRKAYANFNRVFEEFGLRGREVPEGSMERIPHSTLVGQVGKGQVKTKESSELPDDGELSTSSRSSSEHTFLYPKGQRLYPILHGWKDQEGTSQILSEKTIPVGGPGTPSQQHMGPGNAAHMNGPSGTNTFSTFRPLGTGGLPGTANSPGTNGHAGSPH